MKDKIRYPKILFGIFIIIWIVLALNPTYRFDWLLENILTCIMIFFLFFIYKRKLMSNISWTLIFLFFLLHITGAHYTYSEVPFASSISQWMGMERNHFDRLVHFLFGLLLTQPLTEILIADIHTSKKWIRFISFCIILAAGVVYELLEWLTAIIVDPKAGTAFLGTQGDAWDAQKDLGLKLLGSLLSFLFPYPFFQQTKEQ